MLMQHRSTVECRNVVTGRINRGRWAGSFTDSAEGELALSLVLGLRKAVTNGNYDSKLGFLLRFCGGRTTPLSLLELTEADFIEYVAWQGLRGTIRMTVKNFMPYMSCFNTLLSELRRPSPILACGRQLRGGAATAHHRRQERHQGRRAPAGAARRRGRRQPAPCAPARHRDV